MLIVIPAKKDSQQLPGKNFIPFLGSLSLVDWTVKQALEVKSPSPPLVAVSTDNTEYHPPDGAIHVPRPKALLQLGDSSWDVVEHVGYSLGYFGTVMVLQPTSPLRTMQHIADCLDLLGKTGQNVTAVQKGNQPNGAVYIRHWKRWNDFGILYRMPWYQSCDIDVEGDMEAARNILAANYLEGANLKGNGHEH